jgi:hypothetical protein
MSVDPKKGKVRLARGRVAPGCSAPLPPQRRSVGIVPKKDAERPTAEPIGCDPAQPVSKPFATPTQNFAPSPAEALGENSEARWKAFYKQRWERRRKLLPKLKLKYPSDHEQESIAQLWGIRNTPAFAEAIRSIILDAHLSNQQFQTLSAPEVRELIGNIATQAEQLKGMLTQLDVGYGSEGSHFEAGHLIEAELYVSGSDMKRLAEYMVLLEALKTAAERAAGKPFSFPRGAGQHQRCIHAPARTRLRRRPRNDPTHAVTVAITV